MPSTSRTWIAHAQQGHGTSKEFLLQQQLYNMPRNNRPRLRSVLVAAVLSALLLVTRQFYYGFHVTTRFPHVHDLEHSIYEEWQAAIGADEDIPEKANAARRLRASSININTTRGISISHNENYPIESHSEPPLRPSSQQNDDRSSSLFLPPCITTNTSNESSSSHTASWIQCAPPSSSIDVILTVYKRDNFLEQLNMIAAQSLQPENIWVIQNENHHDISMVVNAWNMHSKNETIPPPLNVTTGWNASSSTGRRPPLHWLHFHTDSQYHGRLHVAYMMSSAKYVSIWDDDLSVGAGWLEHAVQFLQSRFDKAIVSSGGRLVQEIPDEYNDYDIVYGSLTKDHPQTLQWACGTARPVDFSVQHHTLRRELLRFYLGSPVYTYATGEDMQLSFALQRMVGVNVYTIADSHGCRRDAWATADRGFGANGPHASWRHKPQEPRQWLLCKLIQDGFQLSDYCRNCHNATIVQACIDHFEQKGCTMDHQRPKMKRKTVLDPNRPMDLRQLARYYTEQALQKQEI